MTKQPFYGVEAFALVIQKRRKALGLSRRKLAIQAGVHQTYVGVFERQKHIPSLLSAFALADGLGVPLSELIAEAERSRKRRKKKNGNGQTA